MRNKFLDILKFIAAVFVVFIHIELPGTAGLVVAGVARFAVPVFFISSGYFSYKSVQEKDYNKIKLRIVRLIKLFVISFLCYVAGFIMINQTVFNKVWFDSSKDVTNYLKIILFNYPFDSYFVHLWFLLALIYIYVILIFILKLNLEKTIKYTPVIILFTAFFFDIILGKMQITVTPLLGRNFLMMGLPLFSIGYCIKKYEADIQKSKQLITGTFAVGVGVFVLEFVFLSKKSELYIGMVLVAVSLFLLSIQVDKKLNLIRFRFISYLADVSLYVYIFHNLVNNIILKLLKSFDIKTDSMFDYAYPFIVVIVTVLLSIIIKALKNAFTKKKLLSDNKS